MVSHPSRLFTFGAVVAVLLGGCASGDEPSTRGADPTATAPEGEATAPDDADPGSQGLDPNESVEDGVYRGEGVVLPVPDGFSLDPAAFAQGLVAAVNAEGTGQFTAQAVDTTAVEDQAEGQSLDLDTLIDNVRQQVPIEPEIDEEVSFAGAERAHRFTFLALQGPQEGAPESSVTIILAEDGQGLLGEFVFAASSDAYDEDLADLLLAEAGFDPDSEPPAPQPAQPAQPG